jgi:hypothetical protein
VVERPHDYMLDQADALVPGFYLAGLQRVVPAVVDAWQAGESLESIPGLWIRTHDGGWVATEHQPMLVGDIGVPDRTLLGRARGSGKLGGIGRMAYVMHSDGCRYTCRYCTMSKSGSDIFVRRLPDVLEELKGVTEPNVFIADFEPLQRPEAMLRLADSIEAERIRKNYFLLTRADSAVDHRHVLARWKEVGLRWVYIGIDGHSNARLREIGKGGDMAVNEAAVAAVKQLGLGLAVGITVPVDASREDFAAMAATARRLRAPMLGFTVETPLVGTRFFDDNEHRLTTRDWSLFDMYHATLPTRLPLDEFYREVARLQMLAWRLSTPGVLRHLPWRDILRNAWLGPGAMATQWRSASDHGSHQSGDPAPMEAAV